MAKQDDSRTSYATDLAIRGLLRVALAMPYSYRIPFFGWVTTHVFAPIVGYRGRIRKNLNEVIPELPESERRKIILGVPNNSGRALIEIYSGSEFVDRVKDLPLTGPGVDALQIAHDENRPVILATGHIGNFDALRAALIGKGYRVGGLYKPMHNAYFNRHYEPAIRAIGTPVFPRGRRGLGQLVRFLKTGAMVGIVADQHVHKGEVLEFFGKPAATALSAAELSLKYDAPLIPIYGVRQPNGLDFKIIVEEPVPPSDAVTMTQALNDSLEALVRQYPEQWLWMHRRWKPEVIERQRKRAAARMRPGPRA